MIRSSFNDGGAKVEQRWSAPPLQSPAFCSTAPLAPPPYRGSRWRWSKRTRLESRQPLTFVRYFYRTEKALISLNTQITRNPLTLTSPAPPPTSVSRDFVGGAPATGARNGYYGHANALLGHRLGQALAATPIAASKINRIRPSCHRFGHSVHRSGKGFHARPITSSATLERKDTRVEYRPRARARTAKRRMGRYAY
jgi:hypothetical protein